MHLALILDRTLHFWAVAVMLGGGGFLLLLRDHDIGGAVPSLRIAGLVAAPTGCVWLALTLVGVTGDPASVLHLDDWSAFFTTVFGPPWAVRVALLLACIGLALARRRSRLTLAAFTAVGTALALDQAWLGHAAAGTGALAPAMIASYWVHVVAGFAWVGALTMLCLTLRRADARARRQGLELFSSVGVFVVATIVASGLLNASFHITTLSALPTTTYGRILSFKVAMVLAMVALAFANRAAAAEGETRRVAIGVVVETILGVIVIAAAAALGISEPPS